MRHFTRRDFVNDEAGYKTLIQQRDAITAKIAPFITNWIAPAKQKEMQLLLRELIYAHQQTVSYQTEHEVDPADIDVY